jgi:hypothetical protein
VIVSAQGMVSYSFGPVEMYDGNPVQAAILAIYTGASPVWQGGVAGSGTETSGLVSPAAIIIQTGVMGSACW